MIQAAAYLLDESLIVGGTPPAPVAILAILALEEELVDLVVGQDGVLGLEDLHCRLLGRCATAVCDLSRSRTRGDFGVLVRKLLETRRDTLHLFFPWGCRQN